MKLKEEDLTISRNKRKKIRTSLNVQIGVLIQMVISLCISVLNMGNAIYLSFLLISWAQKWLKISIMQGKHP